MTAAPARAPGEALFCWALVLLGAGVTWQAGGIGYFDSPSAAGVFPLAAGLAMTLGALVAAVSATRRAAPGSGPVLPKDVAAIGALVLAYMAGLEALGFVAASFLFLLLAIGWLQRGRWLHAGLVAGGAVALVYVVFRLGFRVVLPQGWIFA
ncbi:tripartite tricarboxylate transporter TctB family protein [Roseomonas sp. HF4]|uniref:tripartite tricarboxylate transporter TctB family protein n=1 Tax=Roseomonas sp. HF4 TaxID=2562313 RepID=UPI001484F3B1|nr:tripartite tricarboxylate transporter TctB family protein [Roseomonas sp. HF4]